MTSSGNRLDQRSIVIVGAGSGIGKATAECFASEGAKLAILDWSLETASEVAKSCGGTAIQVDVASASSVTTAFEKAAKFLGKIDGLVITAGVFDTARFLDTPPDIWQRTLAVNLTGTFNVCQTAIPYLEKLERSTIVTLGSGVALVPSGPGTAAYAASKGGVISLTRSLAAEFAPKIRVNCVCPGMVDTPMTETVIRDANGQIKSTVIGNYALQRFATPKEIASSILFLTSDESSYVTGITLAVDGGRTFH
ncbi:SDR family oxidoreductase [Ochrobactrum sp. Q0168]|uniref:SDR family NAD(P)-dependent oxidoreductase n=1 Tax=Ochrobactrum sp. Q0168 TaxID=2793241 RepID=UPI0018EC1F60|nr:SDR family oxidoreductase [Ochrobactrum sp. Q0168]